MLKRIVLFLFFYILLIFDCYSTSVQKDSIFQHLKDEVEIAKRLKNKGILARKKYQLGLFYANNGLNAEAILHLNNALEHSSTSNSLTVTIKNEIGKVYLSMKNYALANNYFQDALNISKETNYKEGEATSLSLLGNVYEKQSNYLKALAFEQKSLSLFSSLKNNLGIAKVNKDIGSIYEDLNQFEKAYTYFSSSYKLLKNTNSFDEVDALNNLGDVYRKQGKLNEAITYTNKAFVLAKKLNNSNLLDSATKDLSKVYYLLGNFKKAYEYRVKSEEYNKITLKKQNEKQLNILQTVYESNKKEAKIQLLKEKNKVSNSNQKLLLVALLGIISVVSIVGYFYIKRKKEAQKLQEYKQRTLRAELEQKQIKEAVLEKDVKQKTASLSKYSLHVSQKNKILSEISSQLKNIVEREQINYKKTIKKLAKEIDFNLKQENEWEEFNQLFNDIHPDFSKRLAENAIEKLSPAELKLGMLLRLNLTSKEIASILRVTPDSVRVARHRLRKKLPINSKQELVNFMLSV